uniref:ATPase AAA-type core domain-containing protein n=1 Tax=Eutreptiella gymnastica TaxID=73025 RepID=A0A7S4LBG9_9EUGL
MKASAEYLVTRAGFDVKEVSLGSIGSEYHSKSETNLRSALKSTPTVLLFDEGDVLLRKREGSSDWAKAGVALCSECLQAVQTDVECASDTNLILCTTNLGEELSVCNAPLPLPLLKVFIRSPNTQI